MTDNEIIKALNICIGIQNDCEECPLLEYSQATDECMTELMSNALDLINRQKAEIERLEKDSKRLKKVQMQLDDAMKMYSTIKVEALKEFAERFLKKVHDNHYLLSDQINSKDYGMFTVGIKQAVNETKEEMVGENK